MWIGPTSRVAEFLGAIGAQKSTDGRVLVKGNHPVFGLGGDEIVIPEDCKVRDRDGAEIDLGRAMVERFPDVGVAVKVI